MGQRLIPCSHEQSYITSQETASIHGRGLSVYFGIGDGYQHNDTVFFCHESRIPITRDHNHDGLDDYGTYGSKFYTYTKSCIHRAVGILLDVSLP